MWINTKKMLTFTDYKGIANQTHSKKPFHTQEMICIKMIKD